MRWLVLFVLFVFVSSCNVQKKPSILITHVLAVTEQGDTLRLPINMIKPNVYYKVIHYGNDYWRPYNNHWNYNHNPIWHNSRPIYAPSNNGSNNPSVGNSNNVLPANKPTPNLPNPPKPVVPNRKGGN
tara:strand:- start:576 stop:959 length:384 start_codon:yes stop_codon:yes gene_type:complete